MLVRRGALPCSVAVACAFAAGPARAQIPEQRPHAPIALFVEAGTGFIPYANDVPLMLSGGLHFAEFHEIWLRGGYMPTGDDVRLGFGAAGYRAVLRPGHLVQPFFGGLFAGLPETCSHDALGHPTCDGTPIFIFAGTGGVRLSPVPWVGVNASLSLGIDSYPNPFGMVELGVSFALPIR